MGDTFPSSDLVARPDWDGTPQRTEHRAKLLDTELPGEMPGLELGLSIEGGEVPVSQPGRPQFDTYTMLIGTGQPVRLAGDDATRTRLTLICYGASETTRVAVGHSAQLQRGSGGALLPVNVPVEINTTDEVFGVVSQLVGSPTISTSAWVSVIIERSR